MEINPDNEDNSFDVWASEFINNYPTVEKRAEDILNIIDFAEKELKISLIGKQKFILKIFYNLPINEEDKQEIKWLAEHKEIIIPENYQYMNFKELVVVAGRRSGKSVLASLIATYEIYKLLNLYNPQKFYGLVPGTVIYVLHCAAETDQAKIVQDFIRGYVKDNAFFKPFIDSISDKEIRFFTRYDKDINQTKGSLRIFSLTSNSASIPGRTAIMVILDELARMMDTNGRLSGNQVYQALTPSIKSFKDLGKIVDISSPLTKGGIFYDLYVQSRTIKSMVCFQYATWEFNTQYTKEDFREDYEKNPEWAQMEYGAEFGDVLERAFDWDQIDRMIDKGRSPITMNSLPINFVICCDPATKNDRYGVAWGHSEMREGHKWVIIDGLKYFEATFTKDTQGNKQVIEVDLDSADNFVMTLAKQLQHISCIAYDQGKSTSSIQRLKKLGMNAIETTFTQKYKTTLYHDVKGLLNQGRLRVYDPDNDQYKAVNLLIDEMKHLECQQKGESVHIGHPMFGAVVTDDLYDCVSNLAHILLEDSPKKVVHNISIAPRIAHTRMIG